MCVCVCVCVSNCYLQTSLQPSHPALPHSASHRHNPSQWFRVGEGQGSLHLPPTAVNEAENREPASHLPKPLHRTAPITPLGLPATPDQRGHTVPGDPHRWTWQGRRWRTPEDPGPDRGHSSAENTDDQRAEVPQAGKFQVQLRKCLLLFVVGFFPSIISSSHPNPNKMIRPTSLFNNCPNN